MSHRFAMLTNCVDTVPVAREDVDRGRWGADAHGVEPNRVSYQLI